MISLDFTQLVTGLDGKNLKDSDCADAKEFAYSLPVANTLLMSNLGNPIKNYDLAFKFFKDGKADLDESDTNHLKEVMLESKSVATLLKVPILKIIDAALLSNTKA